MLLFSKRDCEREIDWYQSVKETEGSVEDTSFGQMRNINQFGQYTIGSTRRQFTTNRADIIFFRLVQIKQTKRLSKVNYTLNELRDLESKLELITGRDSSEHDEKDRFVEVS